MDEYTMEDYRYTPSALKTEFHRWLAAESFLNVRAIEIKVLSAERRYIELTCHEQNPDGSIKVSEDEEDGGHCIYHVTKRRKVKTLPPFTGWFRQATRQGYIVRAGSEEKRDAGEEDAVDRSRAPEGVRGDQGEAG